MKNHLQKIYALFALGFIYIATTAFDPVRNNGIAGFAGSPGEETCASGTCHVSYALNSGPGSLAISAYPAFTNNQYVPGQNYTVTVNVAQSGRGLFGLGLEALGATNSNAGTLSVSGFSGVQLKTATNGRRNVVHTLNGGTSSTGSKNFTFSWTAPTAGNVTLYVSGVAANADNDEALDYVYNTSLALTPQWPAGLEDALNNNPVNIHYDAVSTQLKLDYFASNTNVQISLVSMNGSKIDLKNEKEAGLQTQNFTLSSYNLRGMYIVAVQLGNKTYTKKIIL